MPEKSTTPDLVELSRRLLEAVNRLDVDAIISFYAPHAVWRAAGGYTVEGRAAIRRFVEELFVPLDDVHCELEEFIDLGNGVVFSVIILTSHPVGSSGELRTRYASVGVWTDGLIERVTDYTDNIDDARPDAERLAEERG